MRTIINGLFFLMIFSVFMACNSEKNGQESVSENTTKDQNAQVQNKPQANHPARTVAEGMPFKVEAMGAPVKEQIRQQEVARDRELRQQHLNTGGLEWTTFDKIAREKNKKTDKKYLVDVYTEWCGWCKVMDKKTFTDPQIQEYLRENFHIVKFDAEQREPVSFKGKDYEWVSGGRRGINKLALELLGNRMSYPTLVYLDENMNKITASPGYKTPEQLIAELKAISDMKS